jgi:hypothetical protein
MDELRSLIQTKLEEIQDIEVSAEVPDEVIEIDKTYFSFTLDKNYFNSDFDKNFTYTINLNGILKRKSNGEENTLKILDDAQDKVENALKELNIKTTFQDVSVLDNIKKTRVSGKVRYNEINKGLL